MIKPRPPHIDIFRDRHGRLRVYFRKGKGKRIPLPPDIGSDEFKAAYAAALAGAVAGKRKPGVPGTIGALIESYYRSPEFAALRETTKAAYRNTIEAIREKHAHRALHDPRKNQREDPCAPCRKTGAISQYLAGAARSAPACNPHWLVTP
jgi:hypothetical protein